MDYGSMSDVEIKKLLVEKMKEREGVHYALGWLMEGYFYPQSATTERDVAICQLKKYEES